MNDTDKERIDALEARIEKLYTCTRNALGIMNEQVNALRTIIYEYMQIDPIRKDNDNEQ